MGSITEPQNKATFTFIEPDTSQDPWACDYFAIPRPKTIQHFSLPLHNLRDDPALFTSSSQFTLPKHGFTALRHTSALHTKPHLSNDEEAIRNTYLSEVEDLLKQTTGCSKVFIKSCAKRSKHADPPLKTTAQKAADPDAEPERCGLKLDPKAVDLEKPFVGGIKDDEAMKVGPARAVHIDYSPAGARMHLRSGRKDIDAEVGDIVKYEDELREGEVYAGRRYAFYSVWRPLKTVRKDPLALCDVGSVVPGRDLMEFVNKQPSIKGDFLAGLSMLRGDHAAEQRWYWIKEQKPDEVLVIQFFDSHAEKEGRPVGVPHGSPELEGRGEGEEPRESIECRCLAVW